MTFTEAAIYVLRQAGKPLHYKEITEIAITENLLSHVGKTPEITMSSRLTTLTKREGEKGAIEKVRPGVFAIREGAELPDTSEAEASEKDVDGDSQEGDAERQRPPGSDLFDREEDDDDLIFADLDDDKGKRKRRKRRKRDDDGDKSEKSETRDAAASRREKRDVKESSHRKSRTSRTSNTSTRSANRTTANSERALGDWSREKDDGELAGGGLADEMFDALASSGLPMSYQDIAAALVSSGRMAGDTIALVPTVAAALRSDNSRRDAVGRRPRFSVRNGQTRLTEWAHGSDSLRALRDALRAGEKQRDAVRQEFIQILDKLPLVGFVELLASWLNAEAVGGLRAVAPPSAQEGALNLAGNWNRGPMQTRIAIVAFRGVDVTPQAVVAARGALHHYADAAEVWMITTGKVSSEARQEANAAGAPVALLDGMALARAFERSGIGLRMHVSTTLAFDYSLLEDLGADVFVPQEKRTKGDRSSDAEEGRSKRRRRGRRRGRDRDKDGDSQDDGQTKSETDEVDAKTSEPEEDAAKKKPRRSRRKRPSKDSSEATAAKDEAKGSSEVEQKPSDTKSESKSAEKSESKSKSEGTTTRRRRKKASTETSAKRDGESAESTGAN